MKSGHEVRWIPVGKLVAHPRNANVMPAGVMRKLRRHIERTGRYEPLVVRKHPERGGEGFFEMINGHHRKMVLEELGHAEAACLVWELDDREALMLLATVNRLSGEDAAGKRLELLEALSTEWGTAGGGCATLAELLPEAEEDLRRLLEGAESAKLAEAPAVGEMMEAFTVFLKAADKQRLVRTLRETDADAGRALMRWMEERAG